MQASEIQFLVNKLEDYVTPNKINLINNVLLQRTRQITVVMEDFYHPHNASAIMRTCDCFGIQDVYVTQRLHDYNVNPNVVRGASKWLSLKKFEREEDSTAKCFDLLHEKKYKIVGTTSSKEYASISELDLNEPTAFIFGTEKDGLSEYAKKHVDDFVHIPMYGFTESFNVSVSAALLLKDSIERLRKESIQWELSEKEKQDLRFEWYKHIVKKSDLLIDIFLKEHSDDK